jgi:hypothetical protein
MTWAIIVILFTLWMLGMAGGVGDPFIHALLAIAAIMLIYKLLGGRRLVS